VSGRGDDRLVRARARRVAVQVAALVGLGMLVVVALAAVLVVRDQQRTTDRLLSATAARADDVGDPPPGAWLVLRRAGGELVSPGLPSAVEPHLGDGRRTGFRTVSTREGPFRLLTVRGAGEVVQVVYDLGPDRRWRDHMLVTMGVAAAMSLLVAGLLGAVLGRRAVRPLAEALALQRDFVADASHELRTPLTLLSTRAQVLERGLPAASAAQLRADVAGLRTDVHRLEEVVDDLLEAASTGRDGTRSRVDLAQLVAEVVESAAPHAAERGVRLQARQDGAALARVSAPAVRRALLSLVDNAVDHTPAGGEVSITTSTRPRGVVLTVRDTGPGLSAADAERVFERFRSGGQRAGRRHYGLGLALTHEVVLRHGGRLSVLPSERGAAFQLVLPS
jgi:signal transduction histidine kinase